ncbi:MAG: hypothetical protein HN534_01175 [Euryarchaeota archaeon]|jgi:hypothetical protein|nr:hypothetical protein [Euryarchaeota archaeon]MBT3653533.1 hypothetical protein [Euryarchaeota archaeon]MBT3757637.1 hypothetical protein [Euryarchaeota archaeon]MBT4050917.1 hypothetical protein [Euryarchaeota archaeon]MBT4346499.1 hypothetical protein [Euryarchaeota archaeon]
MILLPDYPDKVILAHRIRVERLALLGTLTLIGVGAWWLLPAMDGSTELLARMGPVVVMFAAALLLADLIEYGPVQRSRIGTAANVAWPAVLVFAGIAIGDLGGEISDILGKIDSLIAISIMISITLVLWQVSNRLLGSSLIVRRYRGLTSLGALALSTALIFSLAAPFELFVIILITISTTMIPDLMTKDEDYAARKKFGAALDAAESKLLELRGQGISLEQASSILKIAREEGWSNPEQGLKMVEDALTDAEKIQAIARDLDDIRSDSLAAVERAEVITVEAASPRKAFKLGDREAQHGALREAELMYRRAKNRSAIIVEHWQDALDAIEKADTAIGSESGQQLDNVRNILHSAREAMADENPKEAIYITSSIQGHLDSLTATTSGAEQAILDAQNAIAGAADDIPIFTKDRLEEAQSAMASGDTALAKGLASSIIRDVRETSGAMQEVQRALRQRKQLQMRFPKGVAGEVWAARLAEVSEAAENEKWSIANEKLHSLSTDLQAYEIEIKEAKELHSFVVDEWKEMRRRLDSSNIKADDEMRTSAESAVATATKSLNTGDVQSTLKALGKADELLENLRRRV